MKKIIFVKFTPKRAKQNGLHQKDMLPLLSSFLVLNAFYYPKKITVNVLLLFLPQLSHLFFISNSDATA